MNLFFNCWTESEQFVKIIEENEQTNKKCKKKRTVIASLVALFKIYQFICPIGLLLALFLSMELTCSDML